MNKSKENYETHTILRPADCNCDGSRNCNICDGGLAFCTVCKGGEIQLDEQTCEERMRRTRVLKAARLALMAMAALQDDKDGSLISPARNELRKCLDAED